MTVEHLIGETYELWPLIPKQAAVAVGDIVDNCAKVKPGMNVLLVAANDGVYGGVNIVDSETISWLHSAIVQRGADATVVWCDIPYRPMVLWGEGADPGKAWRVPKIVAAAMKGGRLHHQQRRRFDL